jgi:hypothetical protein
MRDRLAEKTVKVMSYDIPELEQLGEELRAEGQHYHYPSLGPYSVHNRQYCLTCGCTRDPGRGHDKCPNPA